MAESGSHPLRLVPPIDRSQSGSTDSTAEPGLADVLTRQRRRTAELSAGDEQALFLDTLAEYQWARDVAGLAASTLDGLIKPIVEVCGHYGEVPWRLVPRQVDAYFAGVGKQARSTVRRKMALIDGYFAFLELVEELVTRRGSRVVGRRFVGAGPGVGS